MIQTLLWIVAAIACLIGLHRLALWAERRGWIYYKYRKASPGTAPGAFLEIQSLLEPGKKHVIEARAEDRADEEASGDPPSTDGHRSG